jgi:hypothetical protein
MLDTGGMMLTAAGRNLYARGITENVPIVITRIAIGDGELTDSHDWENANDIISHLFDAEQIEYEVVGQDIAQIRFDFTSQTEPDGFTLREIGIFAQYDPSNPNTEEILYAYGNTGDHPDIISPASSFRFTRNVVKILIKISNAANVILNVRNIISVSAANVGGAGIGVFARKDEQDRMLFRSLIGRDGITVIQNGDTILVGVSADGFALSHIVDKFTTTDTQDTFELVKTNPNGALSVIIEGAETLNFEVVDGSVVLDHPIPAGINVWIKEIRLGRAGDMSET